MSQPNDFQTPRKMGIRMSGTELPLESLIWQHVSSPTTAANRSYNIIEIGSAGCTTLRAFKDIISEARGAAEWRVFGFDLPEGKAWSLNWDEIRAAFDGVPHLLGEKEKGKEAIFAANQMYLWLLDNPREFFVTPADKGGFSLPIDFAFIDASHGKSCGYDFQSIEAKVAPGGIVVFHDYGEPEQGTDWQAADREFISVRSYVHRLGLAEPRIAPRQGWRWVGEIKGSRHWNGEGNSCAVVQRTEEPLAIQPELSLD